MRKKLLFFATVAIAALASCSKTEIRPEVESRDVHFVVNTAENEEVKSFIQNNNDRTYTPKWSNGDELAIFIGETKSITKATGVLKNTNATGTTAKFDGKITGIPSKGTFKSFAPAAAFEKGYADGTIGINLASTQKPSSLTIDESCDILVAKEAGYTADANGVVEVNGLYFKRMFSIVKIALNGPASLNGEKVQKFSLTAPTETVLAGRAGINLSTATIDKWTVSKNTITATYTTDAPAFGGADGLKNVVWLVVNPCTIASGAKVVLAGETAGYTFSKEVTLPKDLVFPQSQLAVINLTLDETNCTKKSAVVPVYASVAELIAAGKPTEAGTKVTVTLTDEEITKFYKSGKYTNGVYFMVGTQEVQIYCGNTPSDWEVGGTISGTLTNCDWKLYNSTWELCPADYSELTYKAPLPTCATPVITIAEGGVVSITCETEGATIHYTVGDAPADPTETDAVFSAATLTDGQTIKAIAVAEGYKPSAVASKKYTVGGAASYFVKVTTAPTDWSGEYLIVFGKKAHSYVADKKKDLMSKSSSDLTIVDDKIESTDAVNVDIVKIEKTTNGYKIRLSDGKYLSVPASNACGSNTTGSVFTITLGINGVSISGVDSKNATRTLCNNGTYYRMYPSVGSYKLPQLYKLDN